MITFSTAQCFVWKNFKKLWIWDCFGFPKLQFFFVFLSDFSPIMLFFFQIQYSKIIIPIQKFVQRPLFRSMVTDFQTRFSEHSLAFRMNFFHGGIFGFSILSLHGFGLGLFGLLFYFSNFFFFIEFPWNWKFKNIFLFIIQKNKYNKLELSSGQF